MKNLITNKMNLQRAFILTTLLIGISYAETFAQWYPRDAKPFYAGVVSRVGTRSLTVSSDLDDIKNMSLLQSGTSFGLMAGNRMIQASANIGFFNSSSIELNSPKLTDFDVNFEWEPIRFGSQKLKPFGVYVTAGLNNGSMEFSGSYHQSPKKRYCPKCFALVPLLVHLQLILVIPIPFL
jgi:hypothetical protein